MFTPVLSNISAMAESHGGFLASAMADIPPYQPSLFVKYGGFLTLRHLPLTTSVQSPKENIVQSMHLVPT